MKTYEEKQAAYEEFLRREDERIKCDSFFNLGYFDAKNRAGHNNPAKGTKYEKHYESGYSAGLEDL